MSKTQNTSQEQWVNKDTNTTNIDTASKDSSTLKVTQQDVPANQSTSTTSTSTSTPTSNKDQNTPFKTEPAVFAPENQFEQFKYFQHKIEDPDQLIRLHVISAKFNDSLNFNEVWCTVNVGPQKAQTFKIPLVNSKEVKWDEHFSIEYYDKKEKESFFQVEAHANGKFLGSYKMKMSEIDDAKDVWDKSLPKECPLKSESGSDIGLITIRVRRETKCYGKMLITVKEAELNECAGLVKTAKCVVNLSTFCKECNVAEGKTEGNVMKFLFNNEQVEVEVNKKNHIFDAFIEVWDQFPDKTHETKSTESEKNHISGRIIGQARLPIYDTLSNLHATLPLLSQSAEHTLVGTLMVDAKLDQDSSQKKK